MPPTPDGSRETLVRAAARYPGAVEDFPWGERVAKVGGKVFAFLGRDGDSSIAVAFRLPVSGDHALSLPGSGPTSHGLGKAGWVTIRLDDPASPDVEVLLDWLDESYRAIAPAKLLAQLDDVRGDH